MQIILVPGIAAGIALGLAFMLINGAGDELGYGTREVLGLAAMLAAVLAAQVFALRRHPLGAEAAFAARYFTALLTGVVTALAYGILLWAYFAGINPDYLATFYEEYLRRASEAGDPQLVANAERMESFILDPLSQAMVQFGTALLIAVLTALAATAMTRTRTT